MKYLTLIILAALLPFRVAGIPGREKPHPELNASLIPEKVSKGADAVLRYSETTQKILSDKKFVIKRRYAVTVLNKSGDKFAYFARNYDKKSKIIRISGVFYTSSGAFLRRLGAGDIKDYSAVPSFSLYQDDRMKVYIPDIKEYPYTVIYEYEKVYDGTLDFPDWKPQYHYGLGVEKASLKVIAVNAVNKPRYVCRNIGDPVVSNDGDIVIYNWEIAGLGPVKDEPYSGPVSDRVPVVYFAPGHFTYAKTEGNLSSWAGLGRWISDLNKDRQNLPPETVEKIRNLVAGLDSKREKARAVYEYMQNHTRYVSVQLGIGGFQPFPASDVDEKGYGDCKALSNYTLALLKAVGIEARYTLVKAGYKANDIMTDFPSLQFNHVILCVPDEKDSIWLECTSQEQPFDFLGSFTDDRDVLMIAGDSGVLAHTPKYSMEQNLQIRKAEVRLDDGGDATGEIHTRYAGLQIQNVQDALLLKGEDLKKRYYDELDISDLVIKKIQLDKITDQGLPEIHEHLQVSMKKYMSRGGKRVFLPLNLTNRTSRIPKQLDERQSDLILRYPFIDVDTVVYTIPESLEVEYTPSDVSLTTEFGTYQSTVKVDGRQITYVRKVTMKKGRYPKEMFDQFVALRKKIVKADKGKVLLKQTQLASKSGP